MNPQVLYRLRAADGRLLYVGISCNPSSRFRDHARSPQWTEVASIDLEHFDDRESVAAAEVRAIRTENPVYNVEHNPAVRRQRPPRLREIADLCELEDDLRAVALSAGATGRTADREIRMARLSPGDGVHNLVCWAAVRGVRPNDDRPLGRLMGAYILFLTMARAGGQDTSGEASLLLRAAGRSKHLRSR